MKTGFLSQIWGGGAGVEVKQRKISKLVFCFIFKEIMYYKRDQCNEKNYTTFSNVKNTQNY
jgi:hypothetical protein